MSEFRSGIAAVLLLIVVLMAGISWATDCIDYADYLRWLSSTALDGRSQQVVISGDRAYVAALNSGLHILDITDPRNCEVLASVDSYYTRDVAVDGDLACIVGHVSQMATLSTVNVDLSSPENPRILGTVEAPGGAEGVAMAGGYAFTTGGTDSRLLVIDVSDPENPAIVANVGTPGHGYDIVLSGSHAYIADGQAGLVVIDIADPTVPFVTGYADTQDLIEGVAIVGTTVYVAGYYAGLQVIDVADPWQPQIVGTFETLGNPHHVAAGHGFAYVADGFNRSLTVVDVADPPNMRILGTADCSGITMGATLSGTDVWVASDWGGLSIVDAANSTSPPLIGSVDTSDDARGLACWGDYVLVADYADGLHVVDVSDPQNPVVVGTADFYGYCYNVAVDGDHAFVAAAAGGLRVIDLADPTSPVLVGTVDTAHVMDVAIAHGYAYAAYTEGLLVIDVANPTDPFIVGSLATSPSRGVAVSGHRVCLAGYLGGVIVINVATPTNPILERTIDMPDPCYDVAIADNYAYVACRTAGLVVTDISAAPTHEIVCSLNTHYALGVTLDGSIAYIADGGAGIQVIDVSDPLAPWLLGNFETPGSGYGVAVSPSQVFVASGEDGMLVLPRQCATVTDAEDSAPETTGLRLLASPNPTSGGAVIRFATHGDDPVRACVYDLAGRLVRQLTDGQGHAGNHEIHWDGRDAGGRAVAAGVYFVRVTTPIESSTARVVVVR